MNFLALSKGPQRADVENEIGEFHDIFPAKLPAAGQRPDAREQFDEGKRLGEVIIGARVQAADDVGKRVTRSEHQDWSFLFATAKLAGNFQAVHLEKHNIEQNDVERG